MEILTWVVREFWGKKWSKNILYFSLFIHYEVSHECWSLDPEPNVHFVVALAKYVPMVRAMCRSECEILLSCDQVAFHACFDPNANTTVDTKSENQVWILHSLKVFHKGKDREQQSCGKGPEATSSTAGQEQYFLMPDLQTQSAYLFRKLLKFIKITTCWQFGWEVPESNPVPSSWASCVEQFLTPKLCCLSAQIVFMLRSIIYFHMLSYPVVLHGRCSSGPKTEGNGGHSMFSNVCLPYVQRWLRRNRGLLSPPCKTAWWWCLWLAFNRLSDILDLLSLIRHQVHVNQVAHVHLEL